MTTTLADLLQTQTVEEIFQILLATYQAYGFPVSSWQVGGVERTRLMATATAVHDLTSNYQPGITAGGFVDLAPGTGWMPLLASEMYNLEQELATFTIGNIVLTSASGVGTQIIPAGRIIVTFAATGNRYISNAQIIIPAGPGTVTGSFTAEFAGAGYNDPSNSGSLSLVTVLPGVTLTNPAGNYGDVVLVGAGTGALTLGGSPVGTHLVVVRIDATGQSGAASWSTSLDGSPYVSQGAVASVTNLGGTGINITLANGAYNPSFVIGDQYTFETPGSWITSTGSDIEADSALSQRCKDRWSTLANVGTASLYDLLARSTPSVGSQVTQVVVVPDANINNKLNIVIAGPGGVLPAGVVSDVQTYIGARVPITVDPVVSTPSTLNVTFAGTITCPASLLTTIQGAVQTAMTNYNNSIEINGTVRISAIIDRIMNITGVVDVDSVTINTVAANLTLGSSTSYIIPSLQTLGFLYVTTA